VNIIRIRDPFEDPFNIIQTASYFTTSLTETHYTSTTTTPTPPTRLNYATHIHHVVLVLLYVNSLPSLLSYTHANTKPPGKCGDGPHNGSVSSQCTSCNAHTRCSGCTTTSENHSFNTYMALSPTGIAYSASPESHIHQHGHIHIGSRYYNAEPTDGEEYRWTCCKCGGDNSCSHDVGCASCSDHWRQGCCTVYVVEPRK
jgi:hypothetical protein